MTDEEIKEYWRTAYYNEKHKKEELEKENAQLKEIMQKLIANATNTYSDTNIELQQKKMFSFQDVVNKAKQFLKELEKNES